MARNGASISGNATFVRPIELAINFIDGVDLCLALVKWCDFEDRVLHIVWCLARETSLGSCALRNKKVECRYLLNTIILGGDSEIIHVDDGLARDSSRAQGRDS